MAPTELSAALSQACGSKGKISVQAREGFLNAFAQPQVLQLKGAADRFRNLFGVADFNRAVDAGGLAFAAIPKARELHGLAVSGRELPIDFIQAGDVHRRRRVDSVFTTGLQRSRPDLVAIAENICPGGQPLIGAFWSPAGAHTPNHYDDAPSLYLMICGRKRWRVIRDGAEHELSIAGGDALVVPPDVAHEVWTEAATVALTLTFGHPRARKAVA